VSERPLLLYLVSRFIGLALLLLDDSVLLGPMYARQALDKFGIAQGLWEYPWPMAALLYLPSGLGATSEGVYVVAWLLVTLGIDAAFAALLWRAGGSRMTLGLWLWILVLPALGPLMLVMADLVPAVASAVALLAMSRARHALAGALLSFGGALKLWPLAGLPALALPGTGRQRGMMLAAVFSVGLAMLCATLAVGGLERMWSPFVWQQRRGLQIEAVAALPLLWARQLKADARWTTPNTEFNCYEIRGPGVDVALQVSSIAMLLALIGVAIVWVRALRTPAGVRSPALAARILLLTVLAMVVTNKVFSPQYVIWLAAPLAALGAFPGAPLARLDSALFLGACALTQIVFPHNYHVLLSQGQASAAVLAALTLRDLLLLALGARLAAQAWRATPRRPFNDRDDVYCFGRTPAASPSRAPDQVRPTPNNGPGGRASTGK
jgi:hypothetical protein